MEQTQQNGQISDKSLTDDEHEPLTKVFFIGVDAGDPDLIKQWAQEGQLPTFKKLFQTSHWGSTQNALGIFPGSIWASFFTSLPPEVHGRYWFEQIVPGTYNKQRFHPTDIQGIPFWKTLSEAGKKVAILDVPKTEPIHGLNGVQMTDWTMHDPAFPECRSWPPSLAAEVVEKYGRDPVGKCDAYRQKHNAKELQSLLDRLLKRVDMKFNLTKSLLQQGQWDLFLTVFTETHCVGHQCWHLHDPMHPRHEKEMAQEVGDPILDVYKAIDKNIGALLELVDENTLVFILNTHGMGPHYHGSFLLDEILYRLDKSTQSSKDYLQLETGRKTFGLWKKLNPYVNSILRRMPSSLQTRLQPRWDSQRQKLNNAFFTFYQKDRRWFQVPNNRLYGGIRFNLVGREPNGQIRPGEELNRYRDLLTKDLLELVNPETGKPLVKCVLNTTEHYKRSEGDALPDLLVEWNRETPFSHVSSPKFESFHTPDPEHRTGDHKPDGLFFAQGVGIGSGHRVDPVSIMDFAPTISSFLGVSLDNYVGRSLETILGMQSFKQNV